MVAAILDNYGYFLCKSDEHLRLQIIYVDL